MLIGAVEVKCFEVDGAKYISQTDVAKVIGKTEDSVRDFLNSKAFKASLPKDFQTGKKLQVGNLTYVLNDSFVTTAYWSHWATKGNAKALELIIALATESLDIRLMRTFNQLTQPKVDERIKETNEFLATQERRAAKREHNAFQASCCHHHFSPAQAHEYLTKVVFGTTAKEARELPPVEYSDEVWSDLSVGINHQASAEQMAIYREVKLQFLSYRKGTYQERIDRAYLEATNNLKLG